MSVLNAGCRELDVIDKQSGAAIPLLAFYPAVEIETPRSFGPYAVEAAWAALVAPGQYPLVLISHGSGGSHLTLRTLAQFLARNGWIVLTLQHPRNNRNRNDLAGTAEILENRPRHLRVVVDWVFAEFASSLTGAVAVIGHSLVAIRDWRLREESRDRSRGKRRMGSSGPSMLSRMTASTRSSCLLRQPSGFDVPAHWTAFTYRF